MLRRAREALAALPGTSVVGASGLYLTAPMGGPTQEDYLNQVVELRTTLSPRDLLQAVGTIELALGRERLVRWGPRNIDVDILWYHGLSIAEPDLEVPHPRMPQRRFVLEPLAELAPDLILSDGRTVTEALDGVMEQQVTRFAGSHPEPAARHTAPRPAAGFDNEAAGSGGRPAGACGRHPGGSSPL